MELRNNWYKADKGKHFVLTEKGKELFDRIFPSHADYITKISNAVLSSEEQENLSVLLKKLGIGLTNIDI